MAQPARKSTVAHLEAVQSDAQMLPLAAATRDGEPVRPEQVKVRLRSRVRKSRKHGSERGGGHRVYGRGLVAPPRNQAETEKTNFDLQHREEPTYSTA